MQNLTLVKNNKKNNDLKSFLKKIGIKNTNIYSKQKVQSYLEVLMSLI